jgi:hypothetical protein
MREVYIAEHLNNIKVKRQLNVSSSGSGSSEIVQTIDVFIVGLFTEVCILQSAIDLIMKGFRVWVIQEGTDSLNFGDKVFALEVSV